MRLQATRSVVVSALMSDCVTDSHLQELGDSAVADSDRRIAGFPRDLCVPFYMEAMRLENELLTIYKMVVLCVRREADLVKVASSWGVMVGICDRFADRMSRLKNDHPTCGAESYYDRILDLRNKCRRLQEMHL
jgi:hypothetical protein